MQRFAWMMRFEVFAPRAATIVLWALVAIHFVLPFTPANPHEELRIKVASLILGGSFLGLAVLARVRETLAFAIALVLLLGVYVVSAVGGASPLSEGWLIKLIFALALGGGLAAKRLQSAQAPR